MTNLMRVCFALLVLSPQLVGQLVRIEMFDSGRSIGKASAVCVGETDTPGERLFVTAGHNLEGCNRCRVWWRGEWYEAADASIVKARDVDVGHFRATADVGPMPLYTGGEIPVGATVDVAGFGPEYLGRSRGAVTREARLVSLDTVQQVDGQVVPGDSGGIVAKDDWTLGVINGFETHNPLRTAWTPSRTISECLSRIYTVQCPPGGCPIYIQRRPMQPIIGIPVGPPRMVTQIVPPPPQQYVPQPDPISTPMRGERGPQGPAGPQGPQGPAGPAGRDVEKAHVEAVIAAWLESNRDQLRGEAGRDGAPGPPGERGLIGVPSEAELAAVIDMWVSRNEPRIRELVAEVVREQLRGVPPTDTTAIESRLTALEKRPIRVILSEGGKIRDDETYQPGEPLVFALERLRSGSGGR